MDIHNSRSQLQMDIHNSREAKYRWTSTNHNSHGSTHRRTPTIHKEPPTSLLEPPTDRHPQPTWIQPNKRHPRFTLIQTTSKHPQLTRIHDCVQQQTNTHNSHGSMIVSNNKQTPTTHTDPCVQQASTNNSHGFMQTQTPTLHTHPPTNRRSQLKHPQTQHTHLRVSVSGHAIQQLLGRGRGQGRGGAPRLLRRRGTVTLADHRARGLAVVVALLLGVGRPADAADATTAVRGGIVRRRWLLMVVVLVSLWLWGWLLRLLLGVVVLLLLVLLVGRDMLRGAL